MLSLNPFAIECIGWASTASFLISIVMPERVRLHQIGVFTSVSTGLYAYAHGATAIWVKWVLAFVFHLYMLWKLHRGSRPLLDGRKPE